MLALSIRQPYAELILRGIKTVEYRSRATRIVGERFYLYAADEWSNRRTATTAKAWSCDLAMPRYGGVGRQAASVHGSKKRGRSPYNQSLLLKIEQIPRNVLDLIDPVG